MSAIVVEYKEEEWITTEEARMLYRNGRGIKPKSMIEKIGDKKIPRSAWRMICRGSYVFHGPTLKGLTN